MPFQEIFRTPHALRQAMPDVIDKEVNDGGWMACDIVETGVPHRAYYRCGFRVIMKALRDAKDFRPWSGGVAVAPPTDRREDPMHGEAFREREAEVVGSPGASAFAEALELYRDSFVMSLSGGTFPTFSVNVASAVAAG